ncbi:MAG: hypothetical protein AB7N76_10440 [Planctomycetota bacterium]
MSDRAPGGPQPPEPVQQPEISATALQEAAHRARAAHTAALRAKAARASRPMTPELPVAAPHSPAPAAATPDTTAAPPPTGRTHQPVTQRQPAQRPAQQPAQQPQLQPIAQHQPSATARRLDRGQLAERLGSGALPSGSGTVVFPPEVPSPNELSLAPPVDRGAAFVKEVRVPTRRVRATDRVVRSGSGRMRRSTRRRRPKDLDSAGQHAAVPAADSRSQLLPYGSGAVVTARPTARPIPRRPEGPPALLLAGIPVLLLMIGGAMLVAGDQPVRRAAEPPRSRGTTAAGAQEAPAAPPTRRPDPATSPAIDLEPTRRPKPVSPLDRARDKEPTPAEEAARAEAWAERERELKAREDAWLKDLERRQAEEAPKAAGEPAPPGGDQPAGEPAAAPPRAGHPGDPAGDPVESPAERPQPKE